MIELKIFAKSMKLRLKTSNKNWSCKKVSKIKRYK